MKKIYKTVFPEDFNFNTLSSRPSLISSISEAGEAGTWCLPSDKVGPVSVLAKFPFGAV